MKDTTKIQGATYTDDISGLKLDISKQYTIQDIYLCEAKNITKATLKYLSILVPLFISIGYGLLLLEDYFINNNVLNILIETYTDVSVWLYENISHLIANMINWLLSST